MLVKQHCGQISSGTEALRSGKGEQRITYSEEVGYNTAPIDYTVRQCLMLEMPRPG